MWTGDKSRMGEIEIRAAPYSYREEIYIFICLYGRSTVITKKLGELYVHSYRRYESMIMVCLCQYFGHASEPHFMLRSRICCTSCRMGELLLAKLNAAAKP